MVARRYAAVAAALALAGTACQSKPQPTPAGAQIVARVRERGNAHVVVVSDLGKGYTASLHADATGVVDLAAGRSLVHVAYDQTGVDLGYVEGDEVSDGRVTYLRKTGKRWVRFPDPYLGGVKPYALIADLANIGSLTRVGTDTVRGVKTVHYTGVFAPKPRHTVDVWLAGGLLRRLRVTFPPVDKDSNTESVRTIDLDGYGDQQPVTLPADYTSAATVQAGYDAVAHS